MKRAVAGALCALLLALSPGIAQARFPRAGLEQRLALLMQSRCEALGVPGLAMAVVEHGRVVFEGGYGYTDPTASQKAQPASAFRIQSLVPALAALAILRLQDERHVYVVNPLGFYLDDLPATTASVSIADLIARASRGTPPAASPRSHAATTGEPEEALLETLVLQVSGRSFGDYLHDTFLDPLGMARTGAADDLAAAGIRIARTYAPAARGARWVQEMPATQAEARQPLELVSSIADLRLLAQALLDRDFIGAAAYRRLGFERPPADADAGWSLGWHSETAADFGGLTLVSTSGADSSDGASIWLLPQRDAYVITLANIDVPGLGDVGRAAARMAFAPTGGRSG